MTTEQPTFKVIALDKLPEKKYKKTSKYDGPIDAFLERKIALGQVTMGNKSGEYITRQLVKRLEFKEIKTLWAFMQNGNAYLRTIDSKEYEILMKKRAGISAARKARKKST